MLASTAASNLISARAGRYKDLVQVAFPLITAILSTLASQNEKDVFDSGSINFRTVIDTLNTEAVRAQIESLANEVLLQIPFDENSLYGALVVQAVQIANENNISIGKVTTDFIAENVDLLATLAEDYVTDKDGVSLRECPTFEVAS